MSASIHIPSRSSSLRATPSRTHSCVASRSSESAPLARPSAASSRPAPHPDSARIQSKPPSVRGRKQPHCDPLASAAATTPARSLLRSYDRNQVSGTMKLRQSSILSAAAASMTPSNGVKRWDGSGRRSTPWDGLRRDAELWLPDGDCFVHLYERGHSRRGPSFCVPMEVPSGQLSALKDPSEKMYELYIPAPEDFMKEEAFQWHLTTRNFLAFIFNKPLVGTHLGSALIDLQERLHLFRSAEPSQNQSVFMEYAEDIGYLNFTHRPDNALAMLYYAEHYEIKNLWIDAYAHCVGMNETLFLSTEHDPIPRVTKALITRAYLEMDLHLSRVSKAVSTFLEVELSPSNLGLPQGPRAHLDRFRSFLHAFYVDKFGYWPPPKGTSFSRDLCRSMYYDFRALYDYLVDPDSSDSIQAQKPADGGICVLQNLQAFDKRHKYTPLPHPLPLLPATQLPTGRLQAQRNLVAMKLGNKQTKTDKQLMQLAALTAATNSKKTTVSNAPLVRLYKTFERDSLEKQKEKMLISVTRAPREVRDTDGAHYPLCCLTAGTPPWRNKPAEDASPATDSGYSSAETDISNNSPAEPQPAPSATEVSYSIRPDCEASDYITHTNFQDAPRLSRGPSMSYGADVPAPLRVTGSNNSSPVRPSARRHSMSVPPLSRTASWRNSLGRSLSPFSSRRNSIRIQPQPWCEIQVPGYGNGLNETILDQSSSVTSTPSSPIKKMPPGLNAMRRTSLPAKLTVKTSFISSQATAFSPSTEPIVETDEKRTPPIESANNSFYFKRSVTAPIITPASEPSSITQAIASPRRSNYFHTRHTSAETTASSTSSAHMLRSTSSESAQSSSPNSANTWSPAESGSTATSITSMPSSPCPGDECDEATEDALARTEQLMAELDLEATQEHILRRSDSLILRRTSSRYTNYTHARRTSSVYETSSIQADADFSAAPVSPAASRPSTASSNYSKARRVMGMPHGVGLGSDDAVMARRGGREVVSMYQQLAGEMWVD